MVTADEIPDPDNRAIVIEVNGEVAAEKQYQTADLRCAGRLIEFASSYYTLYPGDLVYTGTPAV